MKLEEIKAAVEAGKKVHWASTGYEVQKSGSGNWFIVCTANNYMVGLTHADGITMNGKPDDFFIAE